ncbi:MAG TPA: DUF2207 domain-containing protein [Actinomycetes bacterium]|nr:DUF2207 domain-containing protein [Actinomycetes bacterium]
MKRGASLAFVVLGLGMALALVLAPALVGGAFGGSRAWAQTGEVTRSYAVTVTVARDGVTHVRERIVYDFGDTPHHGIYRTIPVVYDYPPKPAYERVLEISNIHVTSDAPDQVKTSHSGRYLVIRIGDPNKTITGQHTYVLGYDVRGALNRFSDHVQLDWNALGTQWQAPVGLATVSVSFPAKVTSVVCFQGPQGAALPCTTAVVRGGVAHVSQRDLGADEGVTVSVAAPSDAVAADAAQPILKEKWAVSRAFSVSAPTVGGAGLVALAGLFGVGVLVGRKGRDKRYVGQVPGLTPVGGSGPEETEPLFDRTPVAVEFQPPDGLRPGQVGTLLDERVDPLDVSATIVDLAVRGYLRIEEQERAHWFASRDWTLVQLSTDYSKLLPYEQVLLAKLFAGRSSVQVSELKRTFSKQLEEVKSEMYVDAVRQGFFRSSPQSVRTTWTGIGLFAVALAVGATYLLARYTHAGLIGLGLVVAGLGLLAVAHRMPARTAKGRAALTKTLGFRQYIATAEAEQLRFEEREDIFSRYLPYAIVFHEADRWAKAFASIGAAGAVGAGGVPVSPALAWYVGPPGWDLGSLTDSLSSFAATTGAAMAEAPVSAGTGGATFSGGGFGGGGGGSW